MNRRNFFATLVTLSAGAQSLASRALGAATTRPKPPGLLSIDGAVTQPPPTGAPNTGLNANLNGRPVLANSEWYRDITGLPLHAKSATYLADLGAQVYSQDAGGWTYQGAIVGIPYYVVDSNEQPFVPVVCSSYLGECDLTYAPIPLIDDIVEGYPKTSVYPAVPDNTDRHLVVIDRRASVIYEMWKAYRRVNHWYCANMAVWDMTDGDLQRPFNNTSADVAGLSVMAGLLLGHQVTSGTIDHAIRFTIGHQCPNYLTPNATHASAWGNSNALPFGGRLRLKAMVSETTKPSGGAWDPHALTIIRALKKYGMINADTGLPLSPQGDTSPWDSSQGTGGPAWQDLRLLTTNDFEVVDTGATLYATGSAPTGTPPTAKLTVSAAEIVAGASVTLSPSWTGKALAWLAPIGHAQKVPTPVIDRPIRDSWYQLEVANPYGRVRTVKRVIVTNGLRRYALYDRYISPAGSLANDGRSAAAPWPITVLNDAAHLHLVAGYIIGLLDGTYDVSGLTSTESDSSLLAIPTGVFGKPTVLQAINRRQAILTAGSNPRSIVGSRYQGLSQIQMIGLRFDAPGAQYAATFVSDGAFLVDDCEFSGFTAAAVRASFVSGAFLRGNTVHNTASTTFLRLDKCSDIHSRGTVLDVPAKMWDDWGGPNSGIVFD
jgi:hypothetical protein